MDTLKHNQLVGANIMISVLAALVLIAIIVLISNYAVRRKRREAD